MALMRDHFEDTEFDLRKGVGAGQALTLSARSAPVSFRGMREGADVIEIAGLPRPDLLLYLNAPVSVLLDRIHKRGRGMETGITTDYLSLLDSFYDDWLKSFDLCPVLTIPADSLDFVHKPAHFDLVVARIQDKLAGKEEVVFEAEEVARAAADD